MRLKLATFKVLVILCLMINLQTAFTDNLLKEADSIDQLFGTKTVNNNADWMSKLPYHLTTIPLNYLAIPGSHDSFSYTINSSSPVSPDSNEFLRRFGGLPLAKNVISMFSLTQSQTFTQQLEAGIRYFDLRVCYRREMPEDPYWFCHGMYAMSVIPSLRAVKEFLDAHPKEVVLLDFQHFYDFKDPNEKKLLANEVQKLFGRHKTIPLSKTFGLLSITLQSLWQRGQQVWTFFKGGPIDDHDVWAYNYLESPWANTPNDTKLINFLEERYKKGRSPSVFYIHQGIMTIDAASVFSNLVGGLRKFVSSGSKKFVEWIKEKQLAKLTSFSLVGINICIIDFIEEYDFVNTVLRLNK